MQIIIRPAVSEPLRNAIRYARERIDRDPSSIERLDAPDFG